MDNKKKLEQSKWLITEADLEEAKDHVADTKAEMHKAAEKLNEAEKRVDIFKLGFDMSILDWSQAIATYNNMRIGKRGQNED